MRHRSNGLGSYAPANFNQNSTYGILGRMLSPTDAKAQAFQPGASSGNSPTNEQSAMVVFSQCEMSKEYPRWF